MNNEKNYSKHIIVFIISSLVLTLLMNILVMPQLTKPKVEETNYSFFLDKLEDGEITLVQVKDNQIKFKVESDDKKQVYVTGRMSDPNLVERLHKDKNVVFTENFEERNILLEFLVGWVLPLVFFIVLWNILMKGMAKRMGGGNAMSFGKSNAKIYVKAQTGKTFADVAGQDEAKEALVEIVDFLHNPEKYAEIGANLPKGALPVGPPGTGKTLLAQAVAGEAEVPFFSISGSEFVEMFVGMGAAKVRDLFKQAAEKAPCIVFIDEIDTIGKKRDGNFSGNDEREQTLNQLLTEMDGFDGKKGVVILAATNRPESLDPALLRPGRFDRQIVVGYPDVKGREEILKVHARNKPLGKDVDLKVISQTTQGFTGADLENLLNEAALLAARANRKEICEKDIEEATMKVIAGPEKKSRIVTEHDKKITAYHEAGHAVAAYNLPTQDKVHQVTIIQRGMAAGLTVTRPDTNDMHVSRNQMRESIVMLLGGRVAEEIFLDDICTGASNDIERATKTARNMVTRYGFSDKLGTVAYGSDSDEVFLGKDYGHVQNYSQSIAAQIDDEVKEIIEKAYAQCKEILTANANKMHLLADYLLKYEKIDNDKFERLMRGENIEADEPIVESQPIQTESETAENSGNTEE